MGKKQDIIDLTSSVLPKYGFKFLKGKCEGMKQGSIFKYKIVLCVSNQEFSFLSCDIELPNFKDLKKELINRGNLSSDYVINVVTDHAYPVELKEIEHEFYGKFYFDYGYPPNHLEAYEHLLQNYAMPWFNRFQTYTDVCGVLRKNATSGKLWAKAWNNTDLTPGYYGTNFHVAFGVDAILSRLNNEEGEDLYHVYETYYQKGMKNFLEQRKSKIEEVINDELRKQKEMTIAEMETIYNEMPQLIDRINNITKAQWEEYRKMVSL